MIYRSYSRSKCKRGSNNFTSFFKSKRAGEDDIVKIDKVIAEISKIDGYTPELEQKLKELL